MDKIISFDESQILAERDKHEAWLNHQVGIAGTGVGLDRNGRVCLKIYTNGMPAETKRAISSVLSRLPHDFEETGEFHAFQHG